MEIMGVADMGLNITVAMAMKTETRQCHPIDRRIMMNLDRIGIFPDLSGCA